MLTCHPGLEMLRSIIDHKKIFVTAMNGPAVGGGSAWFTGSSDILLVSSSTYLQVNFSSLGLVPEYGSAINFKESMGVHRANEVMMFGRRLTAEDLEQYGIANKIFPAESFQESVKNYLNEQLKLNDGKSMIEVKRLQNAPLRDSRLIAVVNAMDALAERFVEGAPMARFAEKKKLLEGMFLSHCFTVWLADELSVQLNRRSGLLKFRFIYQNLIVPLILVLYLFCKCWRIPSHNCHRPPLIVAPLPNPNFFKASVQTEFLARRGRIQSNGYFLFFRFPQHRACEQRSNSSGAWSQLTHAPAASLNPAF
jgi:enoyl-CoA hydratase/carnithine racemase